LVDGVRPVADLGSDSIQVNGGDDMSLECISGILFIICSSDSRAVVESASRLNAAEEAAAKFDTRENSIFAIIETSPKQQARQAFHRGETTFLGIRTFALHVPGLSADEYDKHVTDATLTVIAAMGCVVRDEGDRWLRSNASSYAELYNTEMLRLIGTRSPP
jgi:hypothetical protein